MLRALEAFGALISGAAAQQLRWGARFFAPSNLRESAYHLLSDSAFAITYAEEHVYLLLISLPSDFYDYHQSFFLILLLEVLLAQFASQTSCYALQKQINFIWAALQEPWLAMNLSYGAAWAASNLPPPPLDMRITNALNQTLIAR